MDKRKAYETLTKLSAELLRGCEKTAPDGTVLFTPDGVGNYDALWVRDFAYMTEYVGDLMGEKAIGDCIRFILRGQRADGWFPDRVEAQLPDQPTQARGSFREVDLMTAYLAALGNLVDKEAIRAAHLRVVVDPLYGAGRGHLAGLLRDMGVERDILVATTKYVHIDPTSCLEEYAAKIGVRWYAAPLDFTKSRFPGLADYEKGFIKEGVGAGGAVWYAQQLGVSMERIQSRTEALYEKMLDEG